MMIKKMVHQAGALTALCLLTCYPIANVYAQVDEEIEILNKMSAEIASLGSFVVTGDAYTDDRLEEGQIVEHTMDVTLRVDRGADAMRITNRDARLTREIYYGNGVFTVYNSSDNFYAQRDVPDGIEAAASFAVNDLGIDAPMIDFVLGNVANSFLEDAQAVDYLGLSLFRGKTYHQIGIRQPDLDLQVWVAAEGPPLPGKLAISAKWEGGSPRSVFFFSWDTSPDFDRSGFAFEPPAGAARIEFEFDFDQ
jgi:hypothetical protein